jgi:hypothetical protein
MDITGHDSVIFTFAPPREIFAHILTSVLHRWPAALIADANSPLSGEPIAGLPPDQIPAGEAFALFYRDPAMLQHMEQAAYTPMPDGDGPFAVITRLRRDIEFAISTLTELHAADHTPGGIRPPDPYPTWLCSPTVLEVTTVTPDDPGSSPFAAWVLQQVKQACRGAAS